MVNFTVEELDLLIVLVHCESQKYGTLSIQPYYDDATKKAFSRNELVSEIIRDKLIKEWRAKKIEDK